jgi:glycosyltransferase involved in cell wall biosynthesis
MNIIIISQSLIGGGAERRACTLASLMKGKGHQVKVITFYPYDHFAGFLQSADVELIMLSSRKLRRISQLRNFLKKEAPHVVLAFGTSCSLTAKLASLPSRTWGLVVTETGTDLPRENRKAHWDRKSHLFADLIITNSHTNRLIITHFYPHVRGNITTIYNPVDLNLFCPKNKVKNHSLLKIVIASRIDSNKNTMLLIEAIDILRDSNLLSGMEFHWYGYEVQGSTYLKDCMEVIAVKKLHDVITFHKPVQDIEQIYCNADAVLLPSLREGLPNTICEALACGLPVMLSSVCDAGNLVRDRYNGFLFDPNSPISLSKAIQEFKKLSVSERDIMGRRSREIAEKWLASDIIVDKYLEVIKAASERSCHIVNHWPPEVPQTAIEFLKSVTPQVIEE